MIATSGFLTALECTKFVFARGSAPDPAGGAHDVPPDPLVGWGGGYPLPIPHPNKRVTVKVFDHRSHHIDRLRQSVALFDWSDVTCATDITDMYNRFLAALSQLVHDNIPVNTVKLRVHDPAFVTPLIK